MTFEDTQLLNAKMFKFSGVKFVAYLQFDMIVGKEYTCQQVENFRECTDVKRPLYKDIPGNSETG